MLLLADLHAPLHPHVIATDASLLGGGIVKAELSMPELQACLRAVDMRGAAVYFAANKINKTPRPIDYFPMHRFSWSHVLHFPFQHVDSITSLEMTVGLVASRFCLNNRKYYSHRIIRVFDNFSCVCAWNKSRPSSFVCSRA